ncbi:MAG: SUMF1/EgtB/PvdO family nonheme iron enzyme [Polyangiaceae bacterium]
MARHYLALSMALLSCGGRVGSGAPTPEAEATAVPRQAESIIPVAVGRGAAPERCPREMALVTRASGAFCIDRWEASLERRVTASKREPWPSNEPVDGREREMVAVSAAGRRPQGYVSGAQAQVACRNASKRLCETSEWLRACRGSDARTYPYGEKRRPGACNERDGVSEEHPVVALFERFAPPDEDRAKMWSAEWMNDPRLFDLPHGVEPAGSRRECKSQDGVFDLVGNLHEWTADPAGTFVGGYFMDTHQNGEGCGYRTRAHKFTYHDYSTGFRCCRDAEP